MFYTLVTGNGPLGPVAVGKDLRRLENYLLILRQAQHERI